MAVGTTAALLCLHLMPVKCAYCGNTRNRERKSCETCGAQETKAIEPASPAQTTAAFSGGLK